MLGDGFRFHKVSLRGSHGMAVLDLYDADIIMATIGIVHTTGSTGVGIAMADGHIGYLAHAIMHADHHPARYKQVCQG